MPAGSGRYPSGQRGQTVNLLAYAFGGSNPPLPTTVATGLRTARAEGGLVEVPVAPTRQDAGLALVNADSVSCGNSSAVERQPSKLGVAGSNPVSRSTIGEVGLECGRSRSRRRAGARTSSTMGAHVAQTVEHVLGKDGVTGSSPVMGSSFLPRSHAREARTEEG